MSVDEVIEFLSRTGWNLFYARYLAKKYKLETTINSINQLLK